jgi:hypothetical protein
MMRTLLFLLAVFFSLRAESTCNCTLIPVSDNAIAPYELIFKGKVLSVSGCDKTANVTFEIQELYVGKSFATVEIAYDCSSACKMTFAPGETWLVYATYESYGKAKTEYCSHTRMLYPDDENDMNTIGHGMTFDEEIAWLKKKFGVQELNDESMAVDMHHKNIIPKGYTVLWYLGIGLVVVVAAYFVGRRFFR